MTPEWPRWVDLSESKVNRGMRVTCYGCGDSLLYAEAWADLQGPAYKAYYHRTCAERAQAEARP